MSAQEPRRHSEPDRTAGFTSDTFGMKIAPVEHVVKAKTRAEMAKTPDVWKQYNDLSRSIRLVNRAQKGPLKAKAFCGVHDGVMWPDGADPEDSTTWLQPGEFMDVPKEVAFHMVGNIWDPQLPNKADILKRYGDYQYSEPNGGKTNPQGAPMIAVGPAALPDLLVAEASARGKQLAEWKAIFDLYQPEWAKKELVPA